MKDIKNNRHNFTGRIFGKLTLIEGMELWNILDKNKLSYYKTYWVKCACGKEFEKSIEEIYYKNQQSCGCAVKERQKSCIAKDIYPGYIFNNIEVIEYVPGKKTFIDGKWKNLPGQRGYWKCQCICGKEMQITSNRIHNAGLISCGCHTKEQASQNAINLIKQRTRTDRVMMAAERVYKRYKITEFSIEDFIRITAEPCFYCGDLLTNCEPARDTPLSEHTGLTHLTEEELNFYYNGLDRINPFGKYTLDNIVSSCFTCNHAKQRLGQEYFIDKLQQLALNYNNIINTDLDDYRFQHQYVDVSFFPNKKIYYSFINSIRSIHRGYSDGDLSMIIFYQLSQLSCFYCGQLANQSNSFNRAKHYKSSSQYALATGEFKYNGIDRIATFDENDKKTIHNYTNSIPCCKFCNIAKNKKSFSDFLSWIARLHNKYV